MEKVKISKIYGKLMELDKRTLEQKKKDFNGFNPSSKEKAKYMPYINTYSDKRKYSGKKSDETYHQMVIRMLGGHYGPDQEWEEPQEQN